MTDPPTTVEDLDVSNEDDTVKNEDALFQEVSLEQWWRLEGTTPLPLVDVRSCDEFERRRLEDVKNGIIVCHLPLESLLSGERSAELPPRTLAFGILVSVDQKQVAVDFFGATQSKATAASRRPWLVRQVLLDEDPLWTTASQLGICSSSSGTTQALSNKKITHTFPLPRLWKPDPLVEGPLLELLLSNLVVTKNNHDDTLNDTTESEIWDLGCGAGRDVCYLAEEIKARVSSSSSERNKNHGDGRNTTAGGLVVVVVGMDNHKGSARRAMPLWKHRHVSDWTDARLVNLNQIPEFHNRLLDSFSQETTSNITRKRVICLYAIRFLNRKLLQYIVSPQCPLPPGTIFATSHFCKPHKGSSWNFDHPKEKHVLERNELSELFQSWHVMKDDLCLDSDHGRTLVQFIAIR